MRNLFLIAFIFINVQFIKAEPNTVAFVSIPSNANEFYNIFKRKPSDVELANVIKITNQYKKMSNVYLINQIEDIDKTVKKIEKDIVEKNINNIPIISYVIIGHNENGLYYFPNGSSIKLQEIVPILQGLPAIFLSCNAKSYLKDIATSVDFKLTYSEAMIILNDLNNIETNCLNLMLSTRKNAEEVIKILNKKHKKNYNVKFLGATGVLGASFILLKNLDEPIEIQKTNTDSTKIKH